MYMYIMTVKEHATNNVTYQVAGRPLIETGSSMSCICFRRSLRATSPCALQLRWSAHRAQLPERLLQRYCSARCALLLPARSSLRAPL